MGRFFLGDRRETEGDRVGTMFVTTLGLGELGLLSNEMDGKY